MSNQHCLAILGGQVLSYFSAAVSRKSVGMYYKIYYRNIALTMNTLWHRVRNIFLKKALKHIYIAGQRNVNNLLKVRQIRNYFFKPTFLPKNERTNSSLLLIDLFSFVFWKKVKTPKRHFEINWPLVETVFCKNKIPALHLWHMQSLKRWKYLIQN